MLESTVVGLSHKAVQGFGRVNVLLFISGRLLMPGLYVSVALVYQGHPATCAAAGDVEACFEADA